MNTVFIEPTDILFFRDAIPMSAGQGSGAGCRLPFPSLFHEALRSSLLRSTGNLPVGKKIAGRPRNAARSGNWHASGHDGETFIATQAFRSLRTIGPMPWHQETGLMLPVPLDASRNGNSIAVLQLLRDHDVPAHQEHSFPSDYRALCLPVPTVPPGKETRLSGWWTCGQYSAYLGYDKSDKPHTTAADFFNPTPTSKLWEPEHRIGVAIDPGSFASKEHQLYSGAYLRPDKRTRFVAWVAVADPARATGQEMETRQWEQKQLSSLEWLLLGGEFRLARILHRTDTGKVFPDPISSLRHPPSAPAADGPCILKWVLVTPALFAHGLLPGWCADTANPGTKPPMPMGRVCLKDLAGRAHLISWCIGKPKIVSGWDVVEGRPKPTMLAVPEGSVYYFLCEDRKTAEVLSHKLHWQPRSDFYGEKGCGYGFVSFDVQMHPTSTSIVELATEVFK